MDGWECGFGEGDFGDRGAPVNPKEINIRGVESRATLRPDRGLIESGLMPCLGVSSNRDGKISGFSSGPTAFTGNFPKMIAWEALTRMIMPKFPCSPPRQHPP